MCHRRGHWVRIFGFRAGINVGIGLTIAFVMVQVHEVGFCAQQRTSNDYTVGDRHQGIGQSGRPSGPTFDEGRGRSRLLHRRRGV